jgi:hypothetical protein
MIGTRRLKSAITAVVVARHPLLHAPVEAF